MINLNYNRKALPEIRSLSREQLLGFMKTLLPKEEVERRITKFLGENTLSEWSKLFFNKAVIDSDESERTQYFSFSRYATELAISLLVNECFSFNELKEIISREEFYNNIENIEKFLEECAVYELGLYFTIEDNKPKSKGKFMLSKEYSLADLLPIVFYNRKDKTSYKDIQNVREEFSEIFLEYFSKEGEKLRSISGIFPTFNLDEEPNAPHKFFETVNDDIAGLLFSGNLSIISFILNYSSKNLENLKNFMEDTTDFYYISGEKMTFNFIKNREFSPYRKILEYNLKSSADQDGNDQEIQFSNEFRNFVKKIRYRTINYNE